MSDTSRTPRRSHRLSIFAAMAALIGAKEPLVPDLRPRPHIGFGNMRPNNKGGIPVKQPGVNPARRRRRALMAEHGITTGRQWRKLRKQLRAEGRLS